MLSLFTCLEDCESDETSFCIWTAKLTYAEEFSSVYSSRCEEVLDNFRYFPKAFSCKKSSEPDYRKIEVALSSVSDVEFQNFHAEASQQVNRIHPILLESCDITIRCNDSSEYVTTWKVKESKRLDAKYVAKRLLCKHENVECE